MTQNKGERGIINAVCKFVKDHYRGTILTIVTGLVLFYVGALVLPNRVKTFAIQYHPTLPDYLKEEDKREIAYRELIDCFHPYQSTMSLSTELSNTIRVEPLKSKVEEYNRHLSILDALIKIRRYTEMASTELIYERT